MTYHLLRLQGSRYNNNTDRLIHYNHYNVVHYSIHWLPFGRRRMTEAEHVCSNTRHYINTSSSWQFLPNKIYIIIYFVVNHHKYHFVCCIHFNNIEGMYATFCSEIFYRFQTNEFLHEMYIIQYHAYFPHSCDTGVHPSSVHHKV